MQRESIWNFPWETVNGAPKTGLAQQAAVMVVPVAPLWERGSHCIGRTQRTNSEFSVGHRGVTSGQSEPHFNISEMEVRVTTISLALQAP